MRNALLALVLAGLAAGCDRTQSQRRSTSTGEPVSHWLEAVKSPDPKTRKKAVDVLGNVGPADPAAIPALTDAVRDKDAAVRDAAVLALSKIGPPAAPRCPCAPGGDEGPEPGRPDARGHGRRAGRRPAVKPVDGLRPR